MICILKQKKTKKVILSQEFRLKVKEYICQRRIGRDRGRDCAPDHDHDRRIVALRRHSDHFDCKPGRPSRHSVFCEINTNSHKYDVCQTYCGEEFVGAPLSNDRAYCCG
jgi:hypothetical protein